MRNTVLTAERLRELLEYNSETGVFRWKVNKGRKFKAGMIAGNINHGYRVIEIDGKLYGAHRLAWLHAHGRWPAREIDHINRIKDDNRIANLREATRAQNRANCGATKNNTAGVRGVFKRRFKFRAQIACAGRSYYLGDFSTVEEAWAAYLGASTILFGEFTYRG